MLLRSQIYRRAISGLYHSRPRLSMPLRAKILHPAFAPRQKMFSTHGEGPTVVREKEGDDPDDVLFNSTYGVRTIELNRQRKLNALNGSMVRKILPRLQEWEKSQMANIIVLKGVGRALCAGGDVVELVQGIKADPDKGLEEALAFFELEYRLDHLIATYSKPYVAIMDGITMGGGAGLSVHAPFRIATERTLFAMPETMNGFFPDVGGSFFLPRLDGEVGTYLALTSHRLKGVQAMYAGIATHYIHSSSLADLEQRLSELNFSDVASLEERWKVVDSTIEEYVTGLPENEPSELSGATREAIDRCFSFNSANEILEALSEEDTKWSRETLDSLTQRSPTSVRIALRQMRIGKKWTISEAFQHELHIACKCLQSHDFPEGVTALLVENRAPRWNPPTLEGSTDSVTDPYFRIGVGDRPRMSLLNDEDYMTYPHAWIGLPSENEVEKLLEEGSLPPDDIIQYFVDGRNGKAGVVEKVSDILRRKTEMVGGRCLWKSPSSFSL